MLKRMLKGKNYAKLSMRNANMATLDARTAFSLQTI